jgi:hypothetical protein
MRKIFLMVPIVLLLAAGCNSSSQPTTQQNSNSSAQETTNPSTNNTPSSAPSATGQNTGTSTATGSTWQGTLQKSDNSAKGNYMLSVNSHIIYLNTSRDYSALVGKPVNVTYNGTLTSFGLVDITAQ